MERFSSQLDIQGTTSVIKIILYYSRVKHYILLLFFFLEKGYVPELYYSKWKPLATRGLLRFKLIKVK